MATAKKELDQVNVSARSNKVADGVRSNGKMQETVHPLRIHKPSLTWYESIQERLPDSLVRALPSNWEHVTVNKQVESITMPKWIAVGLLSAIVMFGYGAWSKSAEQRDALIRIETQLQIAEQQKAANDLERRRLDGDMQAWREITNTKLSEIKGMLSQQQINALERLQNRKSIPQQSQ